MSVCRNNVIYSCYASEKSYFVQYNAMTEYVLPALEKFVCFMHDVIMLVKPVYRSSTQYFKI